MCVRKSESRPLTLYRRIALNIDSCNRLETRFGIMFSNCSPVAPRVYVLIAKIRIPNKEEKPVESFKTIFFINIRLIIDFFWVVKNTEPLEKYYHSYHAIAALVRILTETIFYKQRKLIRRKSYASKVSESVQNYFRLWIAIKGELLLSKTIIFLFKYVFE